MLVLLNLPRFRILRRTDSASSLQRVWRILNFRLWVTVWLFQTLVRYALSHRRNSSGCSFPERILNLSLYSAPPFGSAIFIFWMFSSSGHSFFLKEKVLDLTSGAVPLLKLLLIFVFSMVFLLLGGELML